MRGRVPLSPTVLKERIRGEKWMSERVSEKRPDIDWVKFSRDWQLQDKPWQERLKGFMKETLASVFDRPYIEARDFFEAFGKTSAIKPDELETERTLGVSDRMCWAICGGNGCFGVSLLQSMVLAVTNCCRSNPLLRRFPNILANIFRSILAIGCRRTRAHGSCGIPEEPTGRGHGFRG